MNYVPDRGASRKPFIISSNKKAWKPSGDYESVNSQGSSSSLGKAAGWKRIKTTVGSMEYAVPTTEKSSSNISFNVGGGNVSKIESKVVDRHKPTEDF